MTEVSYWLWLAAKPKITVLVKNDMLRHIGSPKHIYEMNEEQLRQYEYISNDHIKLLMDKNMDRANAIAYDCEKLGIDIIIQTDKRYPKILLAIPDPPIVLYAKGNIPDLEKSPGIGIVGTRRATQYGMKAAGYFGKTLARAGMTVISGMALGIDGAAMKGALSAGASTIAVFAGGLNICYPPEHNFLMADIQRNGAVISENPPNTKHSGYLFPIRNRIISGLSRGVLVVQAPERSGALITAHQALDQGRDVFAIPANIDEFASAGCNILIEKGEAALIRKPEQIIYEYGLEFENLAPIKSGQGRAFGANRPITQPHLAEHKSTKQMWDEIRKKDEIGRKIESGEMEATKYEPQNEVQKIILDAIDNGITRIDDILEQNDILASRALTELTLMELEGAVKNENGVLHRKR